jgi:hypothetical protein
VAVWRAAYTNQMSRRASIHGTATRHSHQWDGVRWLRDEIDFSLALEPRRCGFLPRGASAIFMAEPSGTDRWPRARGRMRTALHMQTLLLSTVNSDAALASVRRATTRVDAARSRPGRRGGSVRTWSRLCWGSAFAGLQRQVRTCGAWRRGLTVHWGLVASRWRRGGGPCAARPRPV